MTQSLATKFRAGLIGPQEKQKLDEPATAEEISAGERDDVFVTPKGLAQSGSSGIATFLKFS